MHQFLRQQDFQGKMLKFNLIISLTFICAFGCNKDYETFEAKVDSNIRNFKLACEIYEREIGQPLNLEDLDLAVSLLNGKNSKGKIFFDGKFIDPNGNPYLYSKNQIISKGKDGILNSKDDLVYNLD